MITGEQWAGQLDQGGDSSRHGSRQDIISKQTRTPESLVDGQVRPVSLGMGDWRGASLALVMMRTSLDPIDARVGDFARPEVGKNL